ncbi:DnaJ-class molecular chaperone [Sinorhizobium fredii]
MGTASVRNVADTRYQSTSGFSDFGEADDIFSSFFSRIGHGQTHARGRDLHFAMEVDFLEAVNGAKKQITLPDRTTLDLQIPPGTQDGQPLRLLKFTHGLTRSSPAMVTTSGLRCPSPFVKRSSGERCWSRRYLAM